MKLCDLIVSSYMEGFTGANIYCDDEAKKESIHNELSAFFDQNNVTMSVVDEKDYGLMVYIPCNNYNNDDNWDFDVIIKDFCNKLEEIRAAYEVNYRAYISYGDEDNIQNYETSSSDDCKQEEVPYDFVAFALKFAVFKNAEFWENVGENADEEGEEFLNVADSLIPYVKNGLLDQKVAKELIDLLDEFMASDEVREELFTKAMDMLH